MKKKRIYVHTYTIGTYVDVWKINKNIKSTLILKKKKRTSYYTFDEYFIALNKMQESF